MTNFKAGQAVEVMGGPQGPQQATFVRYHYVGAFGRLARVRLADGTECTVSPILVVAK